MTLNIAACKWPGYTTELRPLGLQRLDTLYEIILLDQSLHLEEWLYRPLYFNEITAVLS